MVDKKKIKCTVKTNGTPEGTTLLINGADITKTANVKGIYMDISPWGIYITWTILEIEKDIKKEIRYKFNSDDSSVERLEVTKAIGSDSERQFESITDKKLFDMTHESKKLADVINIVNADKK